MNHTLKRATLLSLVAATLVVGCASDSNSGDGGASGGGVNVNSAVPLKSTVYGTVMTNEFVPQAKVEILDMAASQAFFTATTDDGGSFEVPLSTPLPPRALVRVTTATGSFFEREIQTDTGDQDVHLWINVLTTLVAELHRRNPNLTLEQAEAAVRSDLEIDSAVSFDGIPDQPGTPFSHSIFFQRASAEGYAAFLERVVAQLQSQSAPSFTHPDDLAGVNFFFPKALAEKSLSEYALDLVTSAGTSVLESVGTTILGKICAAAGLNIGTEAAYTNIQSQLKDIQDQLSSLRSRLVTDSSRAAYNNIVNSVENERSLLNQMMNLLNDVANQAKLDARNFGIDQPRSTPPSVQTFLSFVANKDFDARAAGEKITEVTITATDNNATFALGKALNAPLGATSPSRSYDNYELRNDKMTLELQNSFNYFAGLAVEAGNILSELSSSLYLPQPLNSPSANPADNVLLGVNSTRSYLLNQYMRLRQGTQLVAGKIGSDIILIDMKPAADANGQNRHYMWYLKADLKNYNDAKKYASSFKVNGLSGWRLPTFKEMELLYSRTKNISGSQTKDKMVKLGFQNISTSHDNDRKYWYEGSRYYTQDSYGVKYYHNRYYNLKDGRDDEDYWVSETPKYTMILVRTCPDFGTGESAQTALSYTNELDSIASVALASDGKKLQATGRVRDQNGSLANLDVTNRVTWTSSDPDVCDVIVTKTGAEARFHSDQEVTLTANFRGKTASQKFRQSAPTLKSIQISPRNLGYLSPPQNGQFQQFDCIATLSDGKIRDLSTNNLNPDRVTWSLHQANGDPLPSDVATVSSVGVVRFGTTALTQFKLRAHHASSGQTDEVTVKVIQ